MQTTAFNDTSPPPFIPFKCFAKSQHFYTVHRPRTAVSKEKAFLVSDWPIGTLLKGKPGNQIGCGAIWGFNCQQCFGILETFENLQN